MSMILVMILIFGSMSGQAFAASEDNTAEHAEEAVEGEVSEAETPDDTEAEPDAGDPELSEEEITEEGSVSDETAEETENALQDNVLKAAGQQLRSGGTELGAYISPDSLSVIIKDALLQEEDISKWETVPWDTTIQIFFSLKLESAGGTFKPGDYLKIQIPQTIDPRIMDGLKIVDKENQNHIATVELEGNTLKITLEEAAPLDQITIDFNITAEFNQTEIGEGGRQVLKFDISGKKVKVPVNFEELDMTINKTATKDKVEEVEGKYYQEWEVEINSFKKELKEIEITDTFPAGTVYAEHSFSSNNDTGWNVEVAEDKRSVKFTHAETIKDTVKITIKTVVDDFSKADRHIYNDIRQNVDYFIFENNVSMKAVDRHGKSLAEVTDNAKITMEPDWVLKTGNFVINDQGIHWTISGNTESASLKDAVVKDILPEGLTLVEDKISVSIGGEKIEDPSDMISIEKAEGDGSSVSFSVRLGDINEPYEITYQTSIYEKFFESQNSQLFMNDAYMEWKAEEQDYSSPVYTERVNAQNKFIEKNGGHWWETRGYTEWYVTINPNAYEISGKVTVVDTLAEAQNKTQTYPEQFWQVFNRNRTTDSVYGYQKEWLRLSVIDEYGETAGVLEEGTDYTIGISGNDRILTIEFEEDVINGKTVVLYVESEMPQGVNSTALINRQTSLMYTNTAELFVENKEEAIGKDTANISVDNAVGGKTTSVALTKARRTAQWRVTVNPTFVKGLGNIVVLDTLPEFMEYVEGSLAVYENKVTYSQKSAGNYTVYSKTSHSADSVNYKSGEPLKIDDSVFTFKVDKDNNTLTLEFKGEYLDGRSYSIYFDAWVIDEFFAETRGTTRFSNKAQVTESSSKASRTYIANTNSLTSTPLIKERTYSKGIFTWDAIINSDLLNTDFSGIKLVDELQAGLMLDIASVKLQKKVGNNYRDISFDANECISYNFIDENTPSTFTFTLPEMSEDDYDSDTGEENFYPGYIYRLRFDTDVLKSGTYSNTIQMKDYMKGNPTASVDGGTVIITDSDGSASTSGKQRITLEKRDFHSGKKLPGAQFELRTEDDILLETGETGADGVIRFQSLLSRQIKYYLYEVESPRGYYSNTEPTEVYIEETTEGTIDTSTLSYIVYNKEIKVPIILKKVDGQGNGLSGAKFSAIPFGWEYDSEGNRSPVVDAAAAADYESDGEGNIVLGELPYGLYAIVEEETPEGYVKPESFMVVEITQPDNAEDDYTVLYWDVVQKDDGSYAYEEREPEDYEEKITWITNELQAYKLTIYKTDEDTNRPLADAEFKVYEYNNESHQVGRQIENPDHDAGSFVSDTYGRAELELTTGYYQIKEVKAPRGYVLNEAPQIIYISQKGLPTVEGGAQTLMDIAAVPEFQVNFKNKQIAENVLFKKVDENRQSLPGAQFKLYRVETDESGDIVKIPDLDDVYRVITSDSEGNIALNDLNAGIYVLQETIAPNGYIRSLDAYIFELKLNGTGNGLDKYYYFVEGGRVNAEDVKNLDDSEESQEIKQQMNEQGYYEIVNEKDIVFYNFTIYKKEAGTNNILPGAYFKIYETDDGINKRDQITTGAVLIDNEYIHITDFAGEINVRLPEGKYILEEVKAPAGYEIVNAAKKFEVKDGESNRSIEVFNTKETINITFEKIDENDEPLEDAKFNLYQIYPDAYENGFPKYDGSGIEENLHFSLVKTIISNPEIAFDVSEGWYVLQEVDAPDGYERSLDMRVVHVYSESDWAGATVDYMYDLYVVEGGLASWSNYDKLEAAKEEDHEIANTPLAPDTFQMTVQKKTDNGEALSGVEFNLANRDEETGEYELIKNSAGESITLTTDGMGLAFYSGKFSSELTEGTYYLVEKNTPEGYEDNGAPTPVELKSGQDTYVEVLNKRVSAEVTMFKQTRKGKPLAQAVFNLYRINAETADDIEAIAGMEDPTEYIEFYKEVTSDGAGKLSLGELPFGYYILQESVAAPGYIRDLEEIIGIEVTKSGEVVFSKINRDDHSFIELDDSYDQTIYNDPEGYSVRIIKEDEDTLTPLKGAEFEIYEYDAATGREELIFVTGVTDNGTYVTDARGEINISLPKGTYKLKEVKVPDGYVLLEHSDDDLVFEVTGTSNETVKRVKNKHILFSLGFTKISDQGDPLKGALFNLYALEVDRSGEVAEFEEASFIEAVMSDENGHVSLKNLEPGIYALQEAVAPEGYARNLDGLVFTIEAVLAEDPETEDEDRIIVTFYDVYGGIVNAEYYQERASYDWKDMYDEDGNQKYDEILLRNEYMYGDIYNLSIHKVHKNDGEEEGKNAVSIQGARFAIWQLYDDDREVRITKDADPDGLYTTNLLGKIELDLNPGTYRITEEEAPEGYILNNGNSYIVEITQDGVIKLNDEVIEGNSVNIEVVNRAQGSLELQKVKEDGEGLPGAEFALYRRVYDSGLLISSYRLVGEYQLVNDSKLLIENLRFGEYVLFETKAPQGYRILDEPIEFTITNEKSQMDVKVENKPEGKVEIHKVDEDGADLIGAKFALYREGQNPNQDQPVDICDMSDTAVGTISGLRPGKYLLYEVKAPEGFQLLSEPAEFEITANEITAELEIENKKEEEVIDPPEGNVEIHKVDEDGKDLVGAKFALYTADQDPEQDQPIEICDMSDTATGTISGLQLGKYLLYEIKAPKGYQLLQKPVEFEIAADQTTAELKIVNKAEEEIIDPSEGKVEIHKLDGDGKSLIGAKFALYKVGNTTREDLPLEICDMSDTAVGTISGLDYGKYLLYEIKAPEGYLGLEEPIEFEITADEATVKLDIVNKVDREIINKPDGKVKIHKVDGEGEALVGAQFALYSEDQDPAQDLPVEICDMSDTAVETISELEIGKYLLYEIKAPEGYQLPEEPVEFEITADDITAELVIENKAEEIIKHPEGKVEIHKVDEDGKSLIGAKFALYKADNNTRENLPLEICDMSDTAVGTISNLQTGKYLLYEIKAPEGYQLQEGPTELEITDENLTVKVEIENKKDEEAVDKPEGTVKIHKVDEKGEGLTGAQFALYKAGQDPAQDLPIEVCDMNDTSSEIISELEAGKYLLYETRAPEGYQVLKDPVEFEITADQIAIELEIENKAEPEITDKADGKVKIHKVDENGESLDGAKFALYRAEQQTDNAQPVDICDMSDTADGEITDLHTGKYLLYEIAAPEGYQILENPIEFEITADAIIAELEIENKVEEEITDQPEGKVEIHKVDGEGKSLTGAKFVVYKADQNSGKGQIVDICDMSNIASGTINNLQTGKYLLYEIKAPQGYQILDKPVEFEITEKQKTAELKIENTLLGGKSGNNITKPGTVLKQSKKVRTGDTAIFMLYAVGLLLSGTVIVTLRKRKKKNQSNK